MTIRTIRLALGLAVLASVMLLGAPSATIASCAMIPTIDNAVATAEIVVVGTVTSTSNANRWAEVAVQEVWRGPDMRTTIVVQGGPAGNAMTSVDRSFQVGVTYVFFPNLDQSTGIFADNSCTSTTELTDDIERLRPADARPPLGGTSTAPTGFDVGSLLPVGVALAVFAVLLVAGVLARGRQEA